MAWTQYLVCLVTGTFYYLFVTSYFTGAGGFPPRATVLALLAFVLGGCASGLGLVAPQPGALLGGGAALPLLVWTCTCGSKTRTSGFAGMFSWFDQVFYALASVPAVLALAASLAVLLLRPEALWPQDGGTAVGIALKAAIGVPAVLATALVIVFVASSFSDRR